MVLIGQLLTIVYWLHQSDSVNYLSPTIVPRFSASTNRQYSVLLEVYEVCVVWVSNFPLIMPPKLKFGEGERILCYHGPLIYEAKCMKGQMKDKVTRYLIHYNGWNKNWDEWVPENRVLKFNEANLQKQRELREQNLYVLHLFFLKVSDFLQVRWSKLLKVGASGETTCALYRMVDPAWSRLFLFLRIYGLFEANSWC